ncbi:enoyl-CoA hydratase [Psychrobacillus sp. BL-248-WT-3]|uniref:enoyl-CoA hydratase/isomerase family protein n=1 Tax=Psychrobacillus sp. BL-248-WT-3 TaxID=2725306 RepID=UPI00146B9BCC|nr:enoyl-CoA hydratase [Psychrobacillus sp. BL-248-WT-3]NME06961.1 enoyl-CoA hydratase [Psychrobacillus sp. BL-248-WT-3]
MSELIKININNKVAILTIDNPPVNVLSSIVARSLLEAFSEMEKDTDVRSIILTGAGQKAFMAGADIKEFPTWLGRDDMVEHVTLNHQLFQYIERLSKPTIAMLNGLTLGGGCELALSCDFRIAEEHVRIGLPEINLGIFPGGGGTQRLPKLIGIPKAKELMFFGDSISAKEALSIGLVNKVISSGSGMDTAVQMAIKLAEKSLNSIKNIKDSMEHGYEQSFNAGIQRETDLFCKTFHHEDAYEGINAFMEKRKPVF